MKYTYSRKRDASEAVLMTYGDLVPMYHEAGHAIAAMHFGAPVLSYGVNPLPHCLPVMWFLSKREKGIVLCAGAMMTKIVFGYEWGHEAADYRLAEKLGDLEEFKAEAEKLLRGYLSEAKFLAGDVMDDYGSRVSVASMECGVPEMTEYSPVYKKVVRISKRKDFGGSWCLGLCRRLVDKMVYRMARKTVRKSRS